MSDCLTIDPILGPRLHGLRWTRIPGTLSLTKEESKGCLRVCTKSLLCCERACNQQSEEEPLPPASASFYQSRDDSSNSDGRGRVSWDIVSGH
jgi:hypothetical protein